VREALGQMAVIEARFAPDLIHMEMALALGKSPEERDKMKKGLDERAAERRRSRDRLKEQLPATFAHRDPNGDEIERFGSSTQQVDSKESHSQ